MPKRLILSVEDKQALLTGIDDARRRLLDYDEMTEDDARTLLRETVGDAVNTILRNHRHERQLS